MGAIAVRLFGDRRPGAQHVTAAVASLTATAAAILLLWPSHWGVSGEAVIRLPFGAFAGDLTLVADSLGVALAVIATTVGSLTVIFSRGYMGGAEQLGRYYALVLIFIGAMCGVVLSGNLLFLFLFWEATAFCSYALIAFHNDDPKAVAAGLKALIITQLGGVGLFIGIIVAAAYLPDLQISTLLAAAGTLPAGVLSVVAFGFLLAAMAKSAQFPLHIWLPDAMEAPTPVSALIHAATMVNAGVYLLARFYPAFAGVPGWSAVVIAMGVTSALLAALFAVFSNDLKQVLAYSTVSQLGYMVAAVGIGAIFESQFHLFSHALFKALLFLSAGAIIHQLGTRDMRQMGGLWRRMPRVAAPFLIGAAALVGLPFFNGFWSKELLLETALESNPLGVYLPLAAGAAITAIYAARMCRMVFIAPPRHGATEARLHVPLSMSLPLALLAAGVMSAWLLAEPLANWMRATLPFHADFILLHRAADSLISTHTVFAPSTLIILSLTLAGLVVGRRASHTPGEESRVAPGVGRIESFFNGSAGAVVSATRHSAALLQKTQTGQLSWNIVGIILGLIALLVLLLQGVV